MKKTFQRFYLARRIHQERCHRQARRDDLCPVSLESLPAWNLSVPLETVNAYSLWSRKAPVTAIANPLCLVVEGGRGRILQLMMQRKEKGNNSNLLANRWLEVLLQPLLFKLTKKIRFVQLRTIGFQRRHISF